MSRNINSFSQNISEMTKNSVNTLSLLEAQQEALTTNDTFSTFEYENASGEKLTYQLPSFDSVVNRLKAVEESINSLHNGYGSINLEDGSRRTLRLTSVPHTPEQITGLDDPSTFTVDSNWFFEELMFPGAQVSIDLTGQIEDSADRVRVTRIILNANDSNAYALWQDDLSQNNYDYTTLKTRLTEEGVAYYEDEETVSMPLVQNLRRGVFTVTEDPVIVSGNVWYPLDTISYSTVSQAGDDQGQNNILSQGDMVSYSESVFEIREIDQNLMRVRLKRVSGVQTPGTYSQLEFYEDPFRDKTIKVRFGAHELNIIYFKGVAEDYNLLGNSWSTPVKFASDELVLSGTTGQQQMTFDEYYSRFIVDWGAKMISEAKENRQSAWQGKIPNAPVLNGANLRVVQINTQINAAMDTADVKNTASEIESVKSQISSLKSTIAAQKTELQSAESLYRYNSIQQQIATNITDLNNLQTTYSTLVSSFQSIVRENSAITTEPKYHIRGFFPVPDYQYRDDSETVTEEIIGFDIAYRYIREDSTATQLNTFSYTAPDGTEYTGTFTDWNIVQGPMKTKTYDEQLGRYVWKSENIADGTETNINQIDIAISKGEKVEIRARSISEAGYPENPLRSAWSNSIIMDFPSTLATGNEVADLIQNVNDDALNITITNNLDSIGVTTHLDDTIPNTNSVNGMFFKHVAKNIAVEETGVSEAGTTVVNSVSLQDVLDKISSQVGSVYSDSQDAVRIANDVSAQAVSRHDWYDSMIERLSQDASLAAQDIRDVSSDLHAFARIQRDEENNPHTDILAKKFILLDSGNNKKVSVIADGSLLKVTNDTVSDTEAPSDIFVNDVLLGGDRRNSLNARLAGLDGDVSAIGASVGQMTPRSAFDDLSTNVAGISGRLDSASSRIDGAETVIARFTEGADNLTAGQLKLVMGGSGTEYQPQTAVIYPDGNGVMAFSDAYSGESLGKIRVSDVYVQDTKGSSDIVSVRNAVNDIRAYGTDLSGLTQEFNSLKDSFEGIYSQSGTDTRISANNGEFDKLSSGDVQIGKYTLMSGTTFEPRDADNNIVNARFANVLLQPDIANAGASISLYSKINELQTYQDTYKTMISDLYKAFTPGNDSELRVSYLTATKQMSSPKLMLNNDTAKSYTFTPGQNYLSIDTFDGVNGRSDAVLSVYDIMLTDPSINSISVRNYISQFGTFSADASLFRLGNSIRNIDFTNLQKADAPGLTTVTAPQAELKVKTVKVDSSLDLVIGTQTFSSLFNEALNIVISQYLTQLSALEARVDLIEDIVIKSVNPSTGQ